MQPVIAVSPCRALPDYQESVRRSGGEARVLEPGKDRPEDLKTWCHGLMLTGGVDVDPARYGEERHEAVRDIEPARDEFELALAKEALAADIPILAICRGMQVINVACGGTLVQDIPSQWETQVKHNGHYEKAARHEVLHHVQVQRGSQVEKIVASEEVGVNSFHHQAVKRVAAGFIVTSRAPDGIIESIEMPGKRYMVGVQWHPEEMSGVRADMLNLFVSFVAAAAM